MKKIFVFAAILTVAFFISNQSAKAIPNPAPVYCTEMGYTVEGENCVFPDGQKCEQWAFYNNQCGQSYKKELACAKAGEALKPGHSCCSGLVSVGVKNSVVNGSCLEVVGSWSICAPCGNGVCDSATENECNCPKDCSYQIKDICPLNMMACPGSAKSVDTGEKDSNGCPIYACANCPSYSLPICKDDELLVTSMTIDENGCFGPSKCVKKNQTCQSGCICNGNVVSCPVNEETIKSEIETESIGLKPISIKKDGNNLEITVGSTKASTSENVSLQESKLYLKKADGTDSEVKIMPETASSKAIERLGQIGFTIELKEVGNNPIYVLTGEKDVKVLWFFGRKMKVSAEVNAQTGDIIKITKPWWSFMAK